MIIINDHSAIINNKKSSSIAADAMMSERNNCPVVVNETSFPPGYSPSLPYILSVSLSVLAACRLCNFRLPLGLFLFPVTFATRVGVLAAFLATVARDGVRSLRSSGIMEPRNR